ncbi:MAG: SCP-2 sterol transfer family protein [Magnetococcales bacterium]|nr:SCP-2 sterol transfer family protein [Magnetococcales bacterium]NGZ27067.1 SCP-2 sterol transfer family protein [Magnetococcales bacterium]
MADLFSADWANGYAQEWNKEPDLSDALAKIDFNSVIGYGFDGEDSPRAVVVVQGGKIVKQGGYDTMKGEKLNWDLRASKDNWLKWIKDEIGMFGLGKAYTFGQLKFKVGDYGAMVKDPRMAGPFIKSFAVMGRVK